MCQVLSGDVQDSLNVSHPCMRKNILPLEAICQQMNQILSSSHQNTPNFKRELVQENRDSEASKSSIPVLSSQVVNRVLNTEKEDDSHPKNSESVSKSASNCTVASMAESNEHHNISPAEVPETRPSGLSTGEADIEMVDHSDISTTNVDRKEELGSEAVRIDDD